mmetsp:Transcript_3048/g.6983  ORF Transcript_3048/g.6983 Transcript_3048/m.6983 type:complete len:341 (+) Transcript_3048:41-1063(+)
MRLPLLVVLLAIVQAPSAIAFQASISRLPLGSPSSPSSFTTRSPSLIAPAAPRHGAAKLSSLSMNLVGSISAAKVAIASIAPAMAPLPYAVAAIVPSCMGLWKSDYGVSYGYGLAMTIPGILTLPHCVTRLALLHSLLYIAYGVRLSLFLLYREMNIPSMRAIKEKIEERVKARGGRLKRLPFIAMCGFLYFAMCAPLHIIAKAPALPPAAAPFIALGWIGFAIAAIGDAQKTLAKVGQPNRLVRSGLYRFCRHPNFTGEFILWTSSAVAGVLTAIAAGTLVSAAGWVALSAVGAMGMGYVLCKAASGLEARQKDKYGDEPGYEEWVESTWAGVTLPSSS